MTVNILGFLLSLILIRRYHRFAIPSSEIILPNDSFIDLRNCLVTIASGMNSLHLFLENDGKPLADSKVRFPRPDDKFKTVSACFRWISLHPKPSEVTEAVSMVRAIYQLGYSVGVKSCDIEQAIEVVVKELKGMNPFGSKIEEIRKPSKGDILDREWMLPFGQGSKVVYTLGLAVKVKDSYIKKAEVVC